MRKYDPEIRKQYHRKRLGKALLGGAVVFIVVSLVALDGRGCGTLVGGFLGSYWVLLAIASLAALLIRLILFIF